MPFYLGVVTVDVFSLEPTESFLPLGEWSVGGRVQILFQPSNGLEKKRAHGGEDRHLAAVESRSVFLTD